MEARFSPSERQQLLAFARQVIERTLCDAEPPAIPKIPALAENGACFVTIKDFRGELRGCIGNLEAFEPLGENILRNAVNAAICVAIVPVLLQIDRRLKRRKHVKSTDSVSGGQ